MRLHEASGSTPSANQTRGLRALALAATLLLGACTAGARNNTNNSEAAAVAGVDQLLVDCHQHPGARQSVANFADDDDPRRVGETLVLGTYDEAQTSPDARPVANGGIRIVYKGGHRYSVEPIGIPAAESSVTVISSTNPDAVASYAIDGANLTVETVPASMPGAPRQLGVMATIACANIART